MKLTKKMFGFVEIGKEFHNNFRKERTDWKDLSDFQANAMKWVGDTIRQTKSQFFWSDGLIAGTPTRPKPTKWVYG